VELLRRPEGESEIDREQRKNGEHQGALTRTGSSPRADDDDLLEAKVVDADREVEALGEADKSFGQFLHHYRRAFLLLVLIGAAIGFVLVVVPQIGGFGSTLERLREGNKTWLAVGVLFEALSIFSYIALFRTVFSCHEVRIGWSASYQITLAGIVATKLLAAAGVGGVALTVWALRASGLAARTVARRMACFEILLYAVFMGSLVGFGIGLASGASGVLATSAPPELTLLPALFGAIVIALVAACRLIPDDIERRLVKLSQHSTRAKRILRPLATVPRTLRDGTVTAISVVRHPQPGLLGAVGYWGFDIATLWASFRAFGAAPPIGVVVMGYFVGQLANALPLPGGIGGVEGGMIGAFLAFGVNGSVAILAVLSYRALSFWLPTVPGAIAYFQLRRTVGQWKATPALEEASPEQLPVRS
jgi:uncharacterized protein (TIRG00374 family)